MTNEELKKDREWDTPPTWPEWDKEQLRIEREEQCISKSVYQE